MNTNERTPLAAIVCVVLAFAGIVLFNSNFAWPTSELGRPPSQREILVLDVLPIVIAGYVIGLCAIAITRFIFPRSSIKMILIAAGACAAVVSLPLLMLSAALGSSNIRDPGTIAMLFAVPLAIVTWAAIASLFAKREAR
jgi:hypothetical protein